jgi:hypothetical protein
LIWTLYRAGLEWKDSGPNSNFGVDGTARSDKFEAGNTDSRRRLCTRRRISLACVRPGRLFGLHNLSFRSSRSFRFAGISARWMHTGSPKPGEAPSTNPQHCRFQFLPARDRRLSLSIRISQRAGDGHPNGGQMQVEICSVSYPFTQSMGPRPCQKARPMATECDPGDRQKKRRPCATTNKTSSQNCPQTGLPVGGKQQVVGSEEFRRRLLVIPHPILPPVCTINAFGLRDGKD